MKKINKLKKLILIIPLFTPQLVKGTEYIVCDNDKKFPYAFAQITSTAMTIIKIVIPILLVIIGMISFFKVTIASNVEDEMKKAKTKLINSIIAATVIFFAFSIVNFAVSLVAGTNNKFMGCVECFIDIEKCPIVEEEKKICTGLINGEFDENCNPLNQENHSSQEFKRTIIMKVDKKASTTTPGTGAVVAGTSVAGGVTAKAKDVKITTVDGVTYANGILIVNKTYSLPSTYGPASAGGTNTDCTSQNCFTTETWNAFSSMKLNAKSTAGIDLWITSGYRSYTMQQGLYNAYASRDGKEKADTYSARPGNSEHQTGLAFDIINASDSFNETAEAKWLNDNAYIYGFILRYPQGKQGITGYKYESWHYRYVGKDLAKILYNNGNWITLEEYFGLTSEYK